MAKGWMRTTSPMFFSIGCAALVKESHLMKYCEFFCLARSEGAKWSSDHERLSDEVEAGKGAVFFGAALFSFEGSFLEALRFAHLL